MNRPCSVRTISCALTKNVTLGTLQFCPLVSGKGKLGSLENGRSIQGPKQRCSGLQPGNNGDSGLSIRKFCFISHGRLSKRAPSRSIRMQKRRSMWQSISRGHVILSRCLPKRFPYAFSFMDNKPVGTALICIHRDHLSTERISTANNCFIEERITCLSDGGIGRPVCTTFRFRSCT